MRRLLNVEQALDLFFQRDEDEGDVAEPESELESEPESEDCDDEVNDPLFVWRRKNKTLITDCTFRFLAYHLFMTHHFEN